MPRGRSWSRSRKVQIKRWDWSQTHTHGSPALVLDRRSALLPLQLEVVQIYNSTPLHNPTPFPPSPLDCSPASTPIVHRWTNGPEPMGPHAWAWLSTGGLITAVSLARSAHMAPLIGLALCGGWIDSSRWMALHRSHLLDSQATNTHTHRERQTDSVCFVFLVAFASYMTEAKKKTGKPAFREIHFFYLAFDVLKS